MFSLCCCSSTEVFEYFLAADFIYEHSWDLTKLAVLVSDFALDLHFDEGRIFGNWSVLIIGKHLESSLAIR